MASKLPLTLRQRVALALVGFSAGCVGAGLLIAYFGSTISQREDLDSLIEGRSNALLESYERGGHNGLVLAVSDSGAAHSSKAWLYVYWNHETGVVYAGRESDIPNDVSPDDGPEMYQIGDATVRGLVVSTPNGNRLGIAGEVTRQVHFEKRLVMWSLGSGAFVVALAILIGLRASRGLIGRVESMNLAVNALLRGQSTTRMSVHSPGDEFDELGGHFNELLDDNERLMLQVREVTDDIAHDLRTPLARIRQHLEGVLLSPTLSDKEESTIRQCLEETDELLSTFQALLSIARIESGAFREETSRVDIAQLMRSAVELYEPLAEDAGLRIVVDAEPGILVDGNRHLLSQALSNLIDNALKYSPACSTIEVSVRRSGSGSAVRVSDRGPGIPQEQRQRVLERFTRLDNSRATPGTGLGLSLVSAVVKLHNATVTLSDNKPGLMVTIEFPAP